jgi:lipopolysaccharide transport system ATP-binding protein
VHEKIVVAGVSKAYRMYGRQTDRIREALSMSGKPLHSDFYALSDVSFTLSTGEILGIMGRNGSGKSTLLKLITGVLTPTCGTISANGKISSLLELGTGFNNEYTGIENIFFYGLLTGMTRQQMDERLQGILDFAEIGDYVHHPVKTYSSGMFARLAFACAINVEPDILLVDEILSVGDMRFQAKCFSRFKLFREQGASIIYVGHDISTMRTFCDTCMWLDKGKVIDVGDPVYISSKYTEFMYLDDGQELSGHKPLFSKAGEMDEYAYCAEKDRQLSAGIDESTSFEFAKSHKAPLAHWGSCAGLIRNGKMSNAAGKGIDFFASSDEIAVSFDIAYDERLDYRNLSAAFSIKNREGTDLVVRTTFDAGISFADGKDAHVEFRLRPLLNQGEYYLVLALENRQNAAISYYEYIEGAKYFKVCNDSEIYGVYVPEVAVSVKEVLGIGTSQ